MLSNKYEFIIFSIITVLLIGIGLLIGTSNFSPDSWGYYELSKTIFSGNIYEFNTYRSYVSDVKSAAFPFGYSISISIVNSLIGMNPINAIFINIALTVLISYLVLRISLILSISYIVSLFLAFSLLLYAPYMDEVYGGRSMPLAILFYLYGIYFILNKKIFTAGIFLGLACLIRFDYLIFSLLTIIYYAFFSKDSSYKLLIGFLLAMSPWILYSYIYFDSFWMSDNSWVSKSAISAFAGDFPTIATKNIFTHPFEWFVRITENYFSILLRLPYYVKDYIIAILGLILGLIYYRKLLTIKDYIFLFFLIIGMAPYATTGYFDARYFTLFFLLFSIFSLYRFSQLKNININNKIIYTLFIFSFLVISKWFYHVIQKSYNSELSNKNQLELIYNLRKEQLVDDKRYIFKSPIFAVKYGALTGGKAAILPTNFDTLDDEIKKQYFKKMEPYKFITETAND